jgi:hypothetical protein
MKKKEPTLTCVDCHRQVNKRRLLKGMCPKTEGELKEAVQYLICCSGWVRDAKDKGWVFRARKKKGFSV